MHDRGAGQTRDEEPASQAPSLASSINLAIVAYSIGMKRMPACSASASPPLPALPHPPPVPRFLLAMTGLPVKRPTRSTPRGASSVLTDALGSLSRAAQPAATSSATAATLARPRIDAPRSGLEDVDADVPRKFMEPK